MNFTITDELLANQIQQVVSAILETCHLHPEGMAIIANDKERRDAFAQEYGIRFVDELKKKRRPPIMNQ